MAKTKFNYCRNRQVVFAGTRLSHTFPQGLGLIEGLGWKLDEPQLIVCTNLVCGPTDINAWVEATGKFIEGDLEPRIIDTTRRLKAKQGGLLDDKQAGVLSNANEVLEKWQNYAIEVPDNDRPVYPLSQYEPLSVYWSWMFSGDAFMEDVVKIVNMFEDASCAMQHVIDIHPEGEYLDPGRAVTQPVPPPSGSFFGNPDDAPLVGWKGGIGLAVGIGLAGFVAWKALTS